VWGGAGNTTAGAAREREVVVEEKREERERPRVKPRTPAARWYLLTGMAGPPSLVTRLQSNHGLNLQQ